MFSRNVGSFLDDNPHLVFDLEQSIIASQFKEILSKNLSKYLDPQRYSNNINLGTDTIYDFVISSNFLSNTHYHNYKKFKSFNNFPFIDKNSIRNNPYNFLTQKYSKDRLWVKETSGTTGTPVSIFYSPMFYFNFLYLSYLKVVGNTDRKILNSTSDVFAISITDNKKSEEKLFVDPTETVGFRIQLKIEQESIDSIVRLDQQLKIYKPKVLLTKPAIFEALVNSKDFNPNINLSLLISSGSDLNPVLKQRIIDKFQIPIINMYGMTEFGIMGNTGLNSDDILLNTNEIYVEVVDNSNNILPLGEEGELVISNITNDAMPLIRYKTGDIGTLNATLSQNGKERVSISKLNGRIINCFKLSSGQLFTPTNFNVLFTKYPQIKEFQVIELNQDRFKCVFEFNSKDFNEKEILRRIERDIRMLFPINIFLRLEVGQFPEGEKFERYKTLNS